VRLQRAARDAAAEAICQAIGATISVVIDIENSAVR